MSRDKSSLYDIVASFELAAEYLGGRSAEELAADQQTQDSIVRRIGIIGEAVKRLSERLRNENPGVPWREMAGMRDWVVHAYDRVDVVRVHEVVALHMPASIDELRRLRDAAEDD